MPPAKTVRTSDIQAAMENSDPISLEMLARRIDEAIEALEIQSADVARLKARMETDPLPKRVPRGIEPNTVFLTLLSAAITGLIQHFGESVLTSGEKSRKLRYAYLEKAVNLAFEGMEIIERAPTA